jgi:hypothetical protein
MKGRLVAFVGVFCIASLIASGVYAKGKPDKPGGETKELITFSGDFLGGDVVEGCCPNAGPFPAYELTVVRGLEIPAGTYSGFLFMNRYGTGRNQEYLVQFWGVSESNKHIAIEIIGGGIDDDRKNKVTTVKFESEDCVHLETGEYIDTVSFTLVRTRL